MARQLFDAGIRDQMANPGLSEIAPVMTPRRSLCLLLLLSAGCQRQAPKSTEWPPQYGDAYRMATQSIAKAASGPTWFEPYSPAKITFGEKSCRVAVHVRELNSLGVPTEKDLRVDMSMFEDRKWHLYAIWDYAGGDAVSKDWRPRGVSIPPYSQE
jgi:hypothetical protein